MDFTEDIHNKELSTTRDNESVMTVSSSDSADDCFNENQKKRKSHKKIDTSYSPNQRYLASQERKQKQKALL